MSINKNDIDRIRNQACDWLAIMNSDNTSGDEVARFDAWLKDDRQHQKIYDEMVLIWSDLENLKNLIEKEDYQIENNLTVWQYLTTLGKNFGTACKISKPVQFSLVGSFILVIILSGSYFSTLSNTHIISGEYATYTAEIKDISLPDGSTVTLGGLSAIEVHYQTSERRVELVSGEAFFSVTQDPGRPFIVATTDAEIRVVGTQFDVRRSSDGVRIAVLVGRVEVTQTQVKDIDGVKTLIKVTQVLTANQKISARKDDNEFAKPQFIERELPGAWRNGRLIYEKAKLSEVISDADRYYIGNIIIDTEDLKELLVSASFRTNQIQEMMDTLSAVLPVSVKKLSNGDFVLRRRDNRG